MTTETTAQDGKAVVKADRKTTEYVVLSDRGRPPKDIGNTSETADADWTNLGRYSATTAPEAMKKAVVALADAAKSGERFVAVPARSWKPMSRKVQQVTKESWSS